MRGPARDQEPGDQRAARWRTVVDRWPRAFGAGPAGATVQIGLNFLVPFLVAGFARQALLRELAAEREGWHAR